MWKLQPPPPWKKSPPFFPSNPHLKVEVLSSPCLFFKIWLEAQSPTAERGGAQYGPMIEEVSLKIVSLIKHN